ncbi:lamin tail domain-containing protein, partial [Flavobacterium sp. DG1-102-2]|uniref:beta strand repeat-containing protein n=1 Tax=Flavobacterium sp. DG1-102-2 TaxID=3081663 RepID=UPI0029499384
MLFIAGNSQAQTIYYHNFDATTTPSHPYTIAPTTLDLHLSGSSWTNTSGSWATSAGSVPPGPSISFTASAGSVITLTFNVAPGYQAEITSFNFWTQRSSSAPTNWSLAINGTNVGSGSNPTTIAPVGVTAVNPPVTGLTGTVSITLSLTGGTTGNFRLDDFTLNGSITPNCAPAIISSILPANGPVNTITTINGSGFTGASSVKFNAIEATAFTVVSDTQIKATVPATATSGNITVIVNSCEATSSTPFTVTTPVCSSSATDIFISELYDQRTGSGGMIELYNPTNAPISLSGYVLQRYGNITDPAPTPGYILSLTGTIPANSTYLINCSAPDPTICAAPTSTLTMGSGFNGNDKFELLKNGVLIDVVEVPFTGPGFTLIRKPNAVVPAVTYNTNDWNNTAHNNSVPNTYCSNLGIHNITTTPLPAITQPATATACENGSITFTTGITPSTGYTYQWKMLNTAGVWVNVANNTNYAGAATNTLTVSQIPLTFDGNQYYCEITSATCNLVSNAAQLYVSTAPAIATATTVQPTCTTPSGSITVTAPAGTGFTYSINGTSFQSVATFSNLAPGNYVVTVRNSGGCTSVTPSITINAVPGAPATAIVSITQPTCTVTTGTITVDSPTGAGLTYSIDGTTFQNGTTFANLIPGTYTVTVMNSAGCSSVSPNHVINSQAVPAVAVTTVMQPTCTTATGTITVDSPTGTGITYSVDGTTFQTTTSFPNLTPGTYSVTVQNSAGCTSVTPLITINSAPSAPAIADVTITQPACSIATGAITVKSPTGTGITYSIDSTTFQAGTSFANLAAGTYTITVMNAAGCTSVSPNHVINTQPISPAVANVTVTQPTCAAPTGTITVNTPVGTGLEYSVDGISFQTATSFANLSDGNYTITVRNAAGCTSITPTITINAIPNAPAVATTSVVQPTCSIATGTITVSAPTGTGITYSLDGITYQAGTSFANLTAGTYTVTVQNAAGCTSVTPNIIIDVQPASPAVADVIITQPTCAVPSGTITINTPLAADLTYSINGTAFQAGTTFNNLAPGSYTVTVRNGAGCTSVTSTITIDAVPANPATANVTVVQPTCAVVTGTININSPLGAEIEYSIDGTIFQTATSFTNLAPGTYTITVRNNLGCSSVSAPVVVNLVPGQPDAATAVIIQPSCSTSTGTITVESPLGADLAYAINGVNFQTSTEFTNVAAGTYTITVMSTSGCYSTSPGFIVNTPPQSAPVAVPPTPIEKCDFNNDGYAVFDMTDVIQGIQNSLTDVTVTVHETSEDADNNVNKVPNTDNYTNVDQHVQTIYLRVQSTLTDCYDIVTLQL